MTNKQEIAVFDDHQRTIIQQMGYGKVPENQLLAFFDRAQIAGLDPTNSSEISLIERYGKGGRTYTLQVGIAGLRRGARRIVRAEGGTYSESVWFFRRVQADGSDTGWLDFWDFEILGMPTNAKVTVTRDGQEFTATQSFSEAKQTRNDGSLTPIWAARPSYMLGKCTAAAAYRAAFPDKLGDLYVDGERFDTDQPRQYEATRQDQRGMDGVRAALAAHGKTPQPDPEPDPQPAPEQEGQMLQELTEKALNASTIDALNALADEAKPVLTEEEWEDLRPALNSRYAELQGDEK